MRRKIFPQKWQWRLNEERKELKEHEFLNPRPKKTKEMIDLKKRYPPKYQKGVHIINKGYRRKLNDEEKNIVKTKRKLYNIERRLTGINTIRFKHIKNIAFETFKGVYGDMNELKAEVNMDY